MAKHINIEMKAKSQNIKMIRSFLLENFTEHKGTDHQVDTYFDCPHGRLKLREGNIKNSLIFYQREDHQGPKQSDVNLYHPNKMKDIKSLLINALGVKAIVDKKREIFFIDNVKFHLDEVKELGEFVEIEAIDFEGHEDVQTLQAQCHEYIDLFKIMKDDFIHCSYSDMILSLG